MSDSDWKLCLPCSVTSGILPKSSWLCFLVKHFSEKLKFSEMHCGFWWCSRLRWTWQPDLVRSLTKLLLAVTPNINYSMILSLKQELINDMFCLDSAGIELILYNKLRTLISSRCNHCSYCGFSALKLQAKLTFAWPHLSPLFILVCVGSFFQSLDPLQNYPSLGAVKAKYIQIP